MKSVMIRVLLGVLLLALYLCGGIFYYSHEPPQAQTRLGVDQANPWGAR